MADGKYYWLKLKRDFFKRHDIQIIEDMPNGKEYILFYLKLLCESVDHNGELRFSEQIPYNENMLATITRTNVDIVRSAIKVFTELNMMEVLDDGTVFMSEVHKMLGSAVDNSNAKRQQRFRDRQKELALCERYGSVTGSVTKNNEEIEIEIEKELEIEKDPPYTPPRGRNADDAKERKTVETAEKKTAETSPRTTVETSFDAFWQAYPKKVGKQAALKAFRRVKVPLETLLTAIERQKCGSQWSRDGGQYIPNPATWLNQGRWEDEVYAAPPSGADSRRRAKAPGEYTGKDFFDDE